MALQKREKVLAAATGVLLVVSMAVWLVAGGESPVIPRHRYRD